MLEALALKVPKAPRDQRVLLHTLLQVLQAQWVPWVLQELKGNQVPKDKTSTALLDLKALKAKMVLQATMVLLALPVLPVLQGLLLVLFPAPSGPSRFPLSNPTLRFHAVM